MSLNDFRRMAAAMDLRMQQLEKAGTRGPEIIQWMVAYLPDLQQIWEGASDAQLQLLCEEFPGFYRYASMMESAAEVDRAKASRPYDDFPELPEPLKSSMRVVLTEAATLERAYQSIIDAGNASEKQAEIVRLAALHSRWLDDRERFLREVRSSSAEVPANVARFLAGCLAMLAERIERVRASVVS
jgi:hypothetical protein